MVGRRASTMLALLLCSAAACNTLQVENEEVVAAQYPLPTAPIRWRVEPGYSNNQPQRLGITRETLAASCNNHPPRDLITIAFSRGTQYALGGTEAALRQKADEPNQACLKEGARWVAALRTQEMCDSNDSLIARPNGLICQDGHVAPNPRLSDRLPSFSPNASPCRQRIDAYLKHPQSAMPNLWHVLCRRL